ncbi:MAG: LCP family protein [Solirubrobacterales bacterium]
MFDQPERFAPWKRFFLGSFVIVLIAAAVAALTAFSQREDLVDTIASNQLDSEVSRDLTGATGGPQTILLIGSDRRKSDRKYGLKPRSDTMMLVRLDPDLAVTPVLSMPRDLKVSIPGRGTAKINEAYSLGGAGLVSRTIRQETGLEINHIVNIDFAGFTQAVDRIGCVYLDVDRRYFNNNVGVYAGDAFAAIDIKAGYQKLCGQKALDYVRFRHFDSDILRGARQQTFLRQAKQQVGVTELFASAKDLKNIIAKNTRLDRGLANGRNLQRLLTLAVKSAGNPIYQVNIPNLGYDNEGASYVLASQSSLRKAARIFERGPKGASKETVEPAGSGATGATGAAPRKKRKIKRAPAKAALPKGMVNARSEGREQAVAAGFGIKLPVYYPTVRLAAGKYEDPRPYRLTTTEGKRVSAWRIVFKTRDLGEYYGVQGVNWADPPILRNPSETRKIGKRTFQLYFEANKLGTVAFRKDGASYWIQNTLTRKLTERQMLALARSLRKR